MAASAARGAEGAGADAAVADAAAAGAGAGAAGECGAQGCGRPGGKLCGRCGKEAYCSAECQRKAWPVHKLVCTRVDSVEGEVRELLRGGRLYSARERLRAMPSRSAKLEAELEELISFGTHSEVIDGAVRLHDAGGDMGRGYVAARDLRAGEPLLFDTAFLSAASDGAKAPHFLMAERLAKRLAGGARRRSAKADAQADFFHGPVKALPLKGNMDRSSLESAALDGETLEQMLVCSIVEGCALYCTDASNSMALFAAAAYFNHSCAPNAEIDSTKSTLLVRASADIPEGREVLISYLPGALLGESLAQRQARLEGGRGFACRCSRCLEEAAAAGEAVADSCAGEAPAAQGLPVIDIGDDARPLVIRKDLGGKSPADDSLLRTLGV